MIFIYELVRFLMANFEVNGGLVQTYPLKNVFCVLWIFHNMEWRCPGWKKIEKLTIRRGGTIILDLRVIESSSHITCSTILLNAMSHLLFASFNDLFSSSFTFYFVFFFALFEIKICTYYQKCYFTFVVFHNDA